LIAIHARCRSPYDTAEWIRWLRSPRGQAAIARVDRLLSIGATLEDIGTS
jgi:hypothetical protein